MNVACLPASSEFWRYSCNMTSTRLMNQSNLRSAKLLESVRIQSLRCQSVWIIRVEWLRLCVIYTSFLRTFTQNAVWIPRMCPADIVYLFCVRWLHEKWSYCDSERRTLTFCLINCVSTISILSTLFRVESWVQTWFANVTLGSTFFCFIISETQMLIK